MGRTNAIIGTKLPELATPAGAADVLFGKEAIDAEGAIITGAMPDNADADVEISVLVGALIPAGRYDGTGRATLTAAEADKVVSGHLLAGVTLMGVPGDSNVVNTADANAAAMDIAAGKTAYVGGVKRAGTLFPIASYLKSLANVFQAAELPESVVINAPNVIDLSNAFNGAYGMETLDLTVSNSVTNLLNMLYFTQTIVTLIIRFSTANVTNFNTAFHCAPLKYIYGALDLSSAGAFSNTFTKIGSQLETIDIVQSTIKKNIAFSSAALSDSSLLSIANGIHATSGVTLTLHATPYARCSALTVYVSGGIAYASDPGGGTPMTLAAFITGASYKNSTLASY